MEYPLLLIHGWHEQGQSFRCSTLNFVEDGDNAFLHMDAANPIHYEQLMNLSKTPKTEGLDETVEIKEVGEMMYKLMEIIKHDLFIFADALPQDIYPMLRQMSYSQTRGRGRGSAPSELSRSQHTSSRTRLTPSDLQM